MRMVRLLLGFLLVVSALGFSQICFFGQAWSGIQY